MYLWWYVWQNGLLEEAQSAKGPQGALFSRLSGVSLPPRLFVWCALRSLHMRELRCECH